MKKALKYIFFVFVIVAVAIQFVPVDRNNPAVISDIETPMAVKTILKRSCYDCHSNESTWPWYSYIAPVSWLVAYDVKEGREELNFSDWSRYAGDSDIKEEIVEEVAEGKMPLPIYLITHRDAKVTPEELATLEAWAGVSAGKYNSEEDEDHDD